MAVLNGKEVDNMAIVITNGEYYIYLNQNGKHRKTKDVVQALQYNTIREAIEYMQHAPAKTDGYYVYDTFTNHVIWKRLTPEERIALHEQKNGTVNIKRRNNGKIKQIKELMPDYIKSDLVWEAVAAKEGIKASGEDYDKFVDKMMGTLKFDKKDDLFDVYPETMVKRMYIEQEAKDKLIKQAKVKYVETTSEDTTEQTQSDGSEDTGNTDNTSENAEVKDTIDTTTGK